MLASQLILHLIAAVLGVWSMTLICRIVLVRLHNRKSRATGPHDEVPLTNRQQRAGLMLAAACLPAAALLTIIGEGIGGSAAQNYTNADALLTAAAAVLLMIAGGATCAGLFFDPPRGRRRCPSCWYDFRGITSPRCPECGREIPSERTLRRTRRSRTVIAIGPLLVTIALGLYAVRLTRSGRTASLLPTPVMIAAIPWLPVSTLRDEDNSLAERIWEGRISDAQMEQVRAKCRDVITSSSNVARVDRVAIFGGRYLSEERERPVVMPGVAVSIYADMFSPDARTSQLASERWERLRWCFPATVGPGTEIQGTVLLLQQVLSGADDGAKRRAWEVAAEIGPPAAPLLVAARQQIDELGTGPSIRSQPLPFIARLAGSNDEAWGLLVRVVVQNQDLLLERREELDRSLAHDFARLEPKLVRVITSDERAAPWAAGVLLAQSPAPAAHLAIVLAVLDSDPIIARRLIVPLARRVPAEEVAERISGMLRSTHPLDQEMGARACVAFGGDRDRFLPRLRERRDSRSEAYKPIFERAIRAIETGIQQQGEDTPP